jgi:hypothetical protein
MEWQGLPESFRKFIAHRLTSLQQTSRNGHPRIYRPEYSLKTPTNNRDESFYL